MIPAVSSACDMQYFPLYSSMLNSLLLWSRVGIAPNNALAFAGKSYLCAANYKSRFMIYDFSGGEDGLAYAKKEAAAIKSRMVCPVHHRKVLFSADYDLNGTHAYITRYCCREHAQRVADAFEEAQLFDFVEIEDI